MATSAMKTKSSVKDTHTGKQKNAKGKSKVDVPTVGKGVHRKLFAGAESDDLDESDSTESDLGNDFHDIQKQSKPSNGGKERSSSKPLKDVSGAAKRRASDEADALEESGSLEESDTTEPDAFEGFDEDDEPQQDAGKTKKQKTLGKSKSKVSDVASDGKKTSKTVEEVDPKTAYVKGMSSKEAHARQKVLTQERKSAKPNADGIQRTKKLWERLRRKSHVAPEERQALVTELFDIVTGNIKDFVFKHDSVRVVQTAVKYANRELRLMIATELQGSFLSLAESRYAKFLIGKLLVHGDAAIRDLIVPEFYGNVRRMMKHPEAAWLLDDVYRGVATRQQKARLLREWYGPEYALLPNSDGASVTSKLTEILAKTPEKRAPIMRSLKESINRLVQKKTTAFTMLHDAMLEYLTNISRGSEEMTEFLEMLKDDEEGDLLKNLAFTKSGSRVVCLSLALATSKDRKFFLKIYREIVPMLAYDVYAHKVILAILETVDDTVLSSKAIFPTLIGKEAAEMEKKVMEAFPHPIARRTLLYLPCGHTTRLLPADVLELLNEVDEARQVTSKKDPTKRHAELLEIISPSLLTMVESHAAMLCQSHLGCQYVSEVLLGCVGEKAKALAAVADLARGDPNQPDHLAARPAAAIMMKKLIREGKSQGCRGIDEVQRTASINFHDILYERIKPHLIEWATGPSSFVVLCLLESGFFSDHDEVHHELRANRGRIEQAAKEIPPPRAVERVDSKQEKGHKRRKTTTKSESTGNEGAATLLRMMEVFSSR